MYRSLLVTLLVVLSGYGLSQLNTNSPYSSQGIGDVNFYGDAYTMGLGNAATALTDSSQVNLYNPSTYSLLANQLPLFSLGVNHFQKTFSNPSGESKGQFTGITHMSLVIPFANRFGIAAALKPFSRAGYEINDHEVISAGDSIFYTYQGKGDVYEVLLGFSGNIIQGRNHNLSVGVNGKYYFGRIENERKTIRKVQGTEVGGMDSKALRAKSFGVEAGFIYSYHLSPDHRFRLAGTYRPGLDSKFEKSGTRVFFNDYHNINSYDTIFDTKASGGNVYIPSKTSIGLSYTFAPTNDQRSSNSRLPSLMVLFDYSMEDWSRYDEQFDVGENTGNYVDSDAIRFGVEYIPHRVALDHGTYIKLYHKMSYRVGAYLINSAYQINGEQLTDKGVTLGLGFPFVMNRAVSTVNFSASYGVLGSEVTGQGIKENYFGFNLGINIAPGYDRWFRKYKLD